MATLFGRPADRTGPVSMAVRSGRNAAPGPATDLTRAAGVLLLVPGVALIRR